MIAALIALFIAALIAFFLLLGLRGDAQSLQRIEHMCWTGRTWAPCGDGKLYREHERHQLEREHYRFCEREHWMPRECRWHD